MSAQSLWEAYNPDLWPPSVPEHLVPHRADHAQQAQPSRQPTPRYNALDPHQIPTYPATTWMSWLSHSCSQQGQQTHRAIKDANTNCTTSTPGPPKTCGGTAYFPDLLPHSVSEHLVLHRADVA
eukprot:CAMPEP_0204252292 /NCGR_PEP_ID=MMETSP0468-20130131/1075_1 /ASSEMBLY_ACC=CAM_ASM_000383 /TAXON_ID=2969 /ORGANISM="Oxyrrhis marina" /LENGTH=123 /DNA_ID=CAMNT_0051225711 /DNA_START=73 /DNA_END=445 /DNA_ORIENTATION=+